MVNETILSKNQLDVQQVAEAIASVLTVEVTIADERLRRIAGTGRYEGRIGGRLVKDSAFAAVLREGRGFIIANPREHAVCNTCEGKQSCEERAEVCCPIMLDGKIIGVIALIACDEAQYQILLANPDGLFDFLQRMADLLAGKIAGRERLEQLHAIQQQLTTLFDTVQEGIIAVDRNGKIVNINAAAAKMLQVSQKPVLGKELALLLSGLPLADSLATGHDVFNREAFRLIRGQRVYYVATVKTWLGGTEVWGAVVTLREMAEVKKIVSNFSTQEHCFSFEMILGDSPALAKAKQEAAQAAAGNVTVLIQGESGTGKELFARAIHNASARRDKPIIAINCAAIPEALLESELFGYEEGAFTGARRGGKPGKFELADGGTVFLDEIGDMSLSLQAKLLRVLQERKIERVGSTETTAIDVRIIAATHKDIEAMVRQGEFRQDLYYRINVFPLQIPSLRQRRQDLPLLIERFLARYRDKMAKNVEGIDADAYACLLEYGWPGNIRELENTIEYLVSIADGKIIEQRHIPQRILIAGKTAQPGSPVQAQPTRLLTIAELEKRAILSAIEQFGLTMRGKAQLTQVLGISKATLYRKLKQYNIAIDLSQNENDESK
ncbi:MAG: sigma 54-interacting transcriptional regulator [Negativicutes bacterium]|nr:sigma 54-interacting transcriptional regulator [Negativicutes bacterium]